MEALRRINVWDRLVEAVLGFAVALLVLCVGLWRLATDPHLPGADPAPDLHSVVSSLGYAADARNRIPVGLLEALAAEHGQAQWLGALPRQRSIDLNGKPTEVAVDFVIGPLFEALRVPLVGRGLSAEATGLPLAAQPVREAVLSRKLAIQLYGTPEAAIGGTLRVGSLQWMLSGEGWAEFAIVGVADAAFAGTNVEQPAALWVGINAWADVVFPAQQIADFRRVYGPSSLAVRTQHPKEFAARLQADLVRLGEPAARIELVRGTGYHPARRARFAAIAEALMLGLSALSVMVVICILAHGYIRSESARHGDHVRALLGESLGRRWRRQSASGGWSALMVLVGAAGLAALLAALAGSYELPIVAALARGARDPTVLAGMALVSALFLVLGPALGTLNAGARDGRRMAMVVVTLFGLLLASIALAWFIGAVSIDRLTRTLRLPMPESVLGAAETAVTGGDYRWMYDTRSAVDFSRALAADGIALASVGPSGGVVESQRAQIRAPSMDITAVLTLNHVSVNYFPVLGIRAESYCGPFEQWLPNWVYVNRHFLREYAQQGAADRLQLIPEDAAPLRVCGVVDDAQVLNARSGLASMVYLPLQQRRHFGVAITAQLPTPEQQVQLKNALAAQFADTTPGPALSVAQRLAEHLRQESQMVALNRATMLLAACIAWVSAMLLGRAAIHANLRVLGTRRALGASPWRLVAITLAGRSVLLWALLAAVAVSCYSAVWRSLALTLPEAWWPTLLAIGAASLLTTTVAALLLRSVQDHRLIEALKSG